jgi:ubiquinol-cytochrome c reductase cytochrome c subunit
MRNVRLFVLAAVTAAFAVGHVTVLAADLATVAKGKTAYVKNGCWQCHGFAGQGSIAGPKLAPEPMPLPAMNAFLRNTRGAMPPYMEAVLSNDDLADIHAYLQSIPKAADYQTIPLLNQP